MILVDNSQIVLSHLFQIMKYHDIKDCKDLLRHMILNTYRMYRSRFHDKYGELVICNDSGKVWRRDIFPYYKQNRRTKRDTSDIDWDAAYTVLSEVKQEFAMNLPYKNIQVERTEADDIIAVLAKKYCETEKVLILSSDKDFQQLQVHPNIEQFSPLKKEMVRCTNPSYYLVEHIIRGDSSDGVPNIFSDDDSCVSPDKRQKPCMMKKVRQVIDEFNESGSFEDEYIQRNWCRNKNVIDLNEIPSNIQDEIIATYENAHVADRSKLFDYFFGSGLVDLMGSIQEF